MGYLLKVAPALHGCCSSAYHLAGTSLLLDDEVHLAKVRTFCKGLNVILNSVFINSSKKVCTVLFSSDDNAIVIFKIIRFLYIHSYIYITLKSYYTCRNVSR